MELLWRVQSCWQETDSIGNLVHLTSQAPSPAPFAGALMDE